MRIDRGLLGWGVFLVVLGAIPLAIAQDWLPSDLPWWQLWPLILIGIGLGILLRKTSFAPVGGLVVAATFGAIIGGSIASGSFPVFGGNCLGGTTGTAFPAQSGSFSGSTANVRLDMGCGDVSVAAGSGSGWRIEGTSDGGRAPTIDASTGSLTARVASTGNVFGARSSWQVALPASPRQSLEVAENAGSAHLALNGIDLDRLQLTINAGDGRVDMTGTTPGSLTGTVNAGSAKIQLPKASLTGDLTVNAGSIALCVPDGVALRLTANDNITASYDYERRGLVRQGNTYTSPDWASAMTRIELTTSANAGSFSLDPPEGCQ